MSLLEGVGHLAIFVMLNALVVVSVRQTVKRWVPSLLIDREDGEEVK